MINYQRKRMHGTKSIHIAINFKKYGYYLFFLHTIFFTACKKINANEVSGPAVTALRPDRGVAGTIVTITGTRFNNAISDNKVFFDSAIATVITASETQLTVVAPPHTDGTVNVSVMTKNRKQSNEVAFEFN